MKRSCCGALPGYRPAGCPVEGEGGCRAGGRGARAAGLQGVVCVACVANRLLLLLLCCPAIGAAKNQQLDFVSLPLCPLLLSLLLLLFLLLLLLLLLLSRCCPIVIPACALCALCPVILALATAPRALPWTTDKAINLF